SSKFLCKELEKSICQRKMLPDRGNLLKQKPSPGGAGDQASDQGVRLFLEGCSACWRFSCWQMGSHCCLQVCWIVQAIRCECQGWQQGKAQTCWARRNSPCTWSGPAFRQQLSWW